LSLISKPKTIIGAGRVWSGEGTKKGVVVLGFIAPDSD
jgi:hypothetical protein